MARTCSLPFGDDKPGYTTLGPESSFGAGSASYNYIETVGNPTGLENIFRASADDVAQSTSFNRRNAKIMAGQYVLPPGTTMGLNLDLCGYTTLTGTNILTGTISGAQTWPFFEAIKALFGAQSYGIVDTVNDAAAATTSFDLTTAASFAIGQGIFVNVHASAPASFTWELAFIKDISTNTITLRWPLSAAPQDTAQIIGGTTFWPGYSNAESSVAMTWQGFTEAGQASTLYELVRGMSGQSATLTLPAEGPARFEETFLCANGEQLAAPGNLPVQPAWAFPGAEDLRGNLNVYRITMTDPTDPTTATRTPIYPEGDITINIDMGTAQSPSAASTYGVGCQDLSMWDCTIDMNIRRGQSNPEYDNFEAQTIYGLQFEWGSQTGRTWCFYVPAAQIDTISGPTAGDLGAIDALTYRVIENNHVDGTTVGEGGDKPFYLFAG